MDKKTSDRINFTQLSIEDRADILNRVRSELNIRSAVIVEKDWWVTAILRALYSLPYAESISFKGGTSLSKCWKLIDRFSEDIDIGIGREFLGFPDELSKTQVSDKLRRAACSFVRERLQHDVRNALAEYGVQEDAFSVHVDITPISTTDPEIVEIAYRPAVKNIAIAEDEYILPKIKIEVSGRSMEEPVERVAIRSMVSEIYPSTPFTDELVDVRAVLPTRTFLEKIFLLHEEFAKPIGSVRVDRMSRHLYDIGEILNTDIAKKALADENLYRNVIAHRRKFIGLKGFDYNTLYPATLNLTIPSAVELTWRNDYTKMREMIYVETPTFDELIGQIAMLNEKIRQLPYHPL